MRRAGTGASGRAGGAWLPRPARDGLSGQTGASRSRSTLAPAGEAWAWWPAGGAVVRCAGAGAGA